MRYALAANLRSRQRLEASVIFLAVDEALLFYSVFECHEIYFSGRCFSRAFWGFFESAELEHTAWILLGRDGPPAGTVS